MNDDAGGKSALSDGLGVIARVLSWFKATPKPPAGWRYCDTCDKFIRPDVRCDYDWGGNCSAADYSWVRDGTIHPVRGGRQGHGLEP